MFFLCTKFLKSNVYFTLTIQIRHISSVQWGHMWPLAVIVDPAVSKIFLAITL